MSEFFTLPKEIGATADIRILKAGKKNHPGKFGDVSFFDVEHDGQELSYSVKSGSANEKRFDDNIGGMLRAEAYFDEEKGQRRYKWDVVEGGQAITRPTATAVASSKPASPVTNGSSKSGCDISIDDAIALGVYLDQQFKMHKVAVGVSSHIIDKLLGNLCFNHRFITDREFIDQISQPDADIPFDED